MVHGSYSVVNLAFVVTMVKVSDWPERSGGEAGVQETSLSRNSKSAPPVASHW